ncbi:hypothetical protein JQM68_13650, partial [Oscillibacter valericigenes]|uniref:hypothetical protein n=1 Tax=Oscillibacter valericigenes TaxID=351091 RepID=UPI001F2CD8EC
GITVSKTPERRFPFHRTGGTPPPEYSTELAAIKPFSNQEFEDLELGKLASRYINLLHTSKDVLKYREKGDYAYFDIWDDIYYERCSLLAIFVNQYGLTIDEPHQAIINEMIIDGENASENLNELLLESDGNGQIVSEENGQS